MIAIQHKLQSIAEWPEWPNNDSGAQTKNVRRFKETLNEHEV